MRRSLPIVPLILATSAILPGCGSHRRVVRPQAEPALVEAEAPEVDPDAAPKRNRVTFPESQAVQNWSTGGP